MDEETLQVLAAALKHRVYEIDNNMIVIHFKFSTIEGESVNIQHAYGTREISLRYWMDMRELIDHAFYEAHKLAKKENLCILGLYAVRVRGAEA